MSSSSFNISHNLQTLCQGMNYSNCLINATGNGDIELVRKWIDSFSTDESSSKLNAVYDAMKNSAKHGYTNIVKLLLDNGANMKHVIDDALVNAASNGYTDTVELLINRHASSLNLSMVKAIANGYIETARFLLDKGATSLEFGLRTAAGKGYNDIVRMLLNKSNINKLNMTIYDNPKIGVISNYTLNSSMSNAAYYGHTNTVKLLIDVGANDMEYLNEAINRAASNGYIDTVKLLIPYNNNIGLNAAIINAIINGYTHIVELLLTSDITNIVSVIKAAIKHNQIDIIDLLIDDADIPYDMIMNIATENISNAAKFDSTNVLRRFLINFNRNNNELESILEVAISNNSVGVVNMLIDEFNINFEDVVHLASLKGKDKILKNIFTSNKYMVSNTLLNIALLNAVNSKSVKTVQLLLDMGASNIEYAIKMASNLRNKSMVNLLKSYKRG